MFFFFLLLLFVVVVEHDYKPVNSSFATKGWWSILPTTNRNSARLCKTDAILTAFAQGTLSDARGVGVVVAAVLSAVRARRAKSGFRVYLRNPFFFFCRK